MLLLGCVIIEAFKTGDHFKISPAAPLLPSSPPPPSQVVFATRKLCTTLISGTTSTRIMEEKLREAACFGDTDALHKLIEAGVDVNGQHKVSGSVATAAFERQCV